jgi:hypothetical protein
MHIETPIYGIIAANKAFYTLQYHKRENYTGMSLQGYDMSVFNGCDATLPIVRFDLAPKWPGFVPGVNIEHVNLLMFDKPEDAHDTAWELDWLKAHNVPVETFAETRLDSTLRRPIC